MVQIGVIGSGRADSETKELAYRVGKLIGKRATLVCGGLGGVMEAASRGCSEVGGEVVGIIPSDRKEDANQYVDYVVVSGMGEARNVLVAKSSDALISIKGGYGTLSEIAISKKIGKKVIGLGSGFSEHLAKHKFIQKAQSPEQAIELVFESLD
ncbi:TIGR00725 family protein [archaeon SCG-AAA382B04]|nr:TIGR00725 family protein [archaeon SCG-AAA382B04]